MKNPHRRPKLGLALGGGGARALAHIGVLKVLDQEKIPVHCLSGTSMGGVIAAAYAAGMPASKIETETLRITRLGELAKLIDISLPRRGLIEGDRVDEYLEELFGQDLTFADLQRPLALAAVDLVTGREVTLREGSVIRAVRASGALPGFFVPVDLGEYRLVDGGALNNVPADLVRQLGAAIVLALDVSLNVHDDKAWEKVGLPAIIRNMWRADAITIAALTEIKLARAQPELILRPDIPADIGTLNGFGQAREVIAAGERAAREILPRLRQLLQPKFLAGDLNALVIYQSLFGCTRQIAQRVAETLEAYGAVHGKVRLLSVEQAWPLDLEGVNLLIMGAPTHRQKAPQTIRSLVHALPEKALVGIATATFDTRYAATTWKTGSAASWLDKALRQLGGDSIVPSASFFAVDREGPLKEGELERARSWAAQILEQLAAHQAGIPSTRP